VDPDKVVSDRDQTKTVDPDPDMESQIAPDKMDEEKAETNVDVLSNEKQE
jgi:hypothetical protein